MISLSLSLSPWLLLVALSYAYSSVQCSFWMPCHCSPTVNRHSNLSNEPTILVRHPSEISLLSFVINGALCVNRSRLWCSLDPISHIQQSSGCCWGISIFCNYAERVQGINIADLEGSKNCTDNVIRLILPSMTKYVIYKRLFLFIRMQWDHLRSRLPPPANVTSFCAGHGQQHRPV